MNSIKLIGGSLIIYSMAVGVLGLFNDPAKANLVIDENINSQPEQPIQTSYQSPIEVLSQYSLSLDVPIMIELDTRESTESDEDNDGQLAGDLYAIGVVSPSGEVAPITRRGLIEIFENAESNGGTLQLSNDQLQTSDTNASDAMSQSQRVLVFDLIVLQKQTGKIYLVPNVRGDSFERNALNDVLRTNGQLRQNTVDLNRLRS